MQCKVIPQAPEQVEEDLLHHLMYGHRRFHSKLGEGVFLSHLPGLIRKYFLSQLLRTQCFSVQAMQFSMGLVQRRGHHSALVQIYFTLLDHYQLFLANGGHRPFIGANFLMFDTDLDSIL